MARERFPEHARCIGSAAARAKPEPRAALRGQEPLQVLTPQVFVEGLRLCDEDTDLGLDFALPRLIERATAQPLQLPPATPAARAAAGAAAARRPAAAAPAARHAVAPAARGARAGRTRGATGGRSRRTSGRRTRRTSRASGEGNALPQRPRRARAAAEPPEGQEAQP